VNVRPGQTWEFVNEIVVLTLRPRPDLDERYDCVDTFWDVLILQHNASPEDVGREDWMGIADDETVDEPSWVRLS